jgi:hypothetical protein
VGEALEIVTEHLPSAPVVQIVAPSVPLSVAKLTVTPGTPVDVVSVTSVVMVTVDPASTVDEGEAVRLIALGTPAAKVLKCGSGAVIV